MMAVSKKMLDQEPSEIEMLLPFHAAGTLSTRDARRVEEALAGDPELARQYAVIREEYAETISLNESLGAPSVARHAEAVCCDRRRARAQAIAFGQPVRPDIGIFRKAVAAYAGLVGEPRRVALLLQAGVIGAVLMKNQTASFQTASLSLNEPSSAPITRDLASSAAPTRALVRFAPEARIADITALLDNYQASIVDGAKGGMFRLQFGNKAMSKDEAASLLARLQREKIVSLAVATP
jgi:hypothetical protein